LYCIYAYNNRGDAFFRKEYTRRDGRTSIKHRIEDIKCTQASSKLSGKRQEDKNYIKENLSPNY
jgi:hypothetical protein